MNFHQSLDFCIVPTPFAAGKRNIVFITTPGKNYLDESMTSSPIYSHVRDILEGHGFVEIEPLTFDCMTSKLDIIPRDELKSELLALGLNYSENLEKTILREFMETKLNYLVHPNSHKDMMDDFDLSLPYNDAIVNEFFVSASGKDANKIPAVGEKVVLHFYLMLDCFFHGEQDLFLELQGDFASNIESHTRNFLKIAKAEFVRLPCKNENVLIFECAKSHKELISEIFYNYTGRFVMKKMIDNDTAIKSMEYFYNILEVKRHVRPDMRLKFISTPSLFVKEILTRSKHIKAEWKKVQDEYVFVENVRSETCNIKEHFLTKMKKLADKEQYEKASEFKKEVEFLDKKIKALDSIEEGLVTKKKLSKICSISKF